MSQEHREEAEWDLDGFKSQLDEIDRSYIFPHVFNNRDREVGGVLVGHKSTRGDLPLIYAAIHAISADEQRATLTFTQDSWEHVHRVMEERYPAADIVGWYHSHPGFGIFLSEHDLFIHHNFFNDPSQIAHVVDPIAGIEGVFTWDDGEVIERFVRRTPLGWSMASLDELENPSQSAQEDEYR
ncbi:MAG: Mov34/MPN/PAD-1 family protein [Solirubrobacterales bacterium]|nr:Mov34/MPN/PAD-1 family protein [Solirubrobacterales bacterium]